MFSCHLNLFICYIFAVVLFSISVCSFLLHLYFGYCISRDSRRMGTHIKCEMNFIKDARGETKRCTSTATAPKWPDQSKENKSYYILLNEHVLKRTRAKKEGEKGRVTERQKESNRKMYAITFATENKWP